MPPEAVVALVVPGVVLWWCFVVFLVSRMSGWAVLARHYRLRDPFVGRRHRFQRLQLRWSNYGGCVTVGTNADGLHLAVVFPFRPGHPPLLIPWGEVVSAEVVRRWYAAWFEFRFAAAPGLSVRMTETLGRAVVADANRSWAAGGPVVE